MIDRRSFLKLILGTAGCAITPTLLFAKPDVRGWRFGVWELQFRFGKDYWARCDCGAEQIVTLDTLLGMDALSCPHARIRGFLPINPDAVICQSCGEHRRFFFNGDGLRIWRCGNCEEADIRAYLRREYGPGSSVQFTANMRNQKDYDRFLLALEDRLRKKARQGYKIETLMIEPIEEIDGRKFRFVRLWVAGEQAPFTWHESA